MNEINARNNKLGFISEEICTNCDEEFDVDTIVSVCPTCGETVIACNACTHYIVCGGCHDGSKFTLNASGKQVGEWDD